MADSLFVGEDLLYVRQLGSGFGHQIVGYPQPDASCDMEIVILHQVVYGADRTVGAVFDREDAVLAQSFFDGVENPFEAVEEHHAGNFKKPFAGRLRVRACDALACHDSFFWKELRRMFEGCRYPFSQV